MKAPKTAVMALLAAVLAAGWVHAPLASAARDRDDEEAVEIDYVALAARLLRDGHVDRAASALTQVDQKDPLLDKRRFQSLRGLLALKQQDYRTGVKAFRAAIAAKPPADEVAAGNVRKGPEPELFLYLAQAHFGLKEYKQTLTALRKGGPTLADEPTVYLMRAQSSWELKRPSGAFSALQSGAKRFPERAEFPRMRVFYLVELCLFQEALVAGQAYLTRADAEPTDYVAVAEALRKGNQPGRAGLILEQAHLRFPANETILLALAHTYIDRERPLAAAGILEDASRLNPKYTVEAAELYKEAGRAELALALNARVSDQAAKYKQRLAVLLQLERYEMVGAMAAALGRVGLLKDEQVRYALAYGYYKAGDFEAAEQHLKLLKDPKLFESANQLRRAMERCAQSGWECS